MGHLPSGKEILADEDTTDAFVGVVVRDRILRMPECPEIDQLVRILRGKRHGDTTNEGVSLTNSEIPVRRRTQCVACLGMHRSSSHANAVPTVPCGILAILSGLLSAKMNIQYGSGRPSAAQYGQHTRAGALPATESGKTLTPGDRLPMPMFGQPLTASHLAELR